MAGLGYAIFETTVGRCGIAWSQSGIVAVQLPEAREIDTRRRLLRQSPEARERSPPPEVDCAMDGIAALLRSQPADFASTMLDLQGVPPFNRRVYECVRLIPRGEILTFGEVARRLGASGAANAVGQAIGRNPFPILVPCHRVLRAAGETGELCGNGGVISKRRLLALEGAAAGGPTLFDVLLPGIVQRSTAG
jgi:methylated-DNA-[protein]-cysteine S-methyltransferase